MIFKGDVIINGEEYVLYSTEDDYRYCDLETAISCCKKEDWDKIMNEYEDADCYFIKTDIFYHSYDEIKESYEALGD